MINLYNLANLVTGKTKWDTVVRCLQEITLKGGGGQEGIVLINFPIFMRTKAVHTNFIVRQRLQERESG